MIAGDHVGRGAIAFPFRAGSAVAKVTRVVLDQVVGKGVDDSAAQPYVGKVGTGIANRRAERLAPFVELAATVRRIAVPDEQSDRRRTTVLGVTLRRTPARATHWLGLERAFACVFEHVHHGGADRGNVLSDAGEARVAQEHTNLWQQNGRQDREGHHDDRHFDQSESALTDVILVPSLAQFRHGFLPAFAGVSDSTHGHRPGTLSGPVENNTAMSSSPGTNPSIAKLESIS